MGAFSNFLQGSSAKKQLLKNAVVAGTVLLSTVGGAVLVGHLTSSNPVANQPDPPVITFAKANQLLVADADQAIARWSFVGPNTNADCDAGVFKDIAGFAASFKNGNQIFLDFHKDQNRYYCFRAITNTGLAGYAAFYVDDLQQPDIIFKESNDLYSAQLSQNANRQHYTDDWSYVSIANASQNCNAASFSDPNQVRHGRSINLEEVTRQITLCFRIAAHDGDYAYQATVIEARSTSKTPKITATTIGEYLYLSADQEIKEWQAVVVNREDACQWRAFNQPTTYRSQVPLAIIRIRPRDEGQTYCLRGANANGLWGYKGHRLLNTVNQTNLILQSNSRGQKQLQVPINQVSGDWYRLPLHQAHLCLKEIPEDIPVLSRSRALNLPSFDESHQLYCWQARGNSRLVGGRALWSNTSVILSYKTGADIKAVSLYGELDNWHYTADPLILLSNRSCRQSFQESSEKQPIQDPLIKNGSLNQFYCFRAQNQQTYYSSWLHNTLPSPDSTQTALAADLGLTDLGKHFFYQIPLQHSRRKADFLRHCPDEADFSCYNPTSRTLHVLKQGDYLKNLAQIKLEVAKAFYDHLPPETLYALRFELEFLYSSQKEALSPSLNNHLFLDNLHRNMYTFLIQNLLVNSGRFQSSVFWQQYLNLLFN